MVTIFCSYYLKNYIIQSRPSLTEGYFVSYLINFALTQLKLSIDGICKSKRTSQRKDQAYCLLQQLTLNGEAAVY